MVSRSFGNLICQVRHSSPEHHRSPSPIHLPRKPDMTHCCTCMPPICPVPLPGAEEESQSTAEPLSNSPMLHPPGSQLLVQRLYRHKVDHMIRDAATTLFRCTQCEEVFAATYRHKLNCEAGVGSGGDPLAAAFRRHIPDRSWKVQRSACNHVQRQLLHRLHKDLQPETLP